jgi:hypothetical protein
MTRPECQNWGNIKDSLFKLPAGHSYYLTKLANYIIQRVVARTRFPLVGANRLDPRCWTETGRLFPLQRTFEIALSTRLGGLFF